MLQSLWVSQFVALGWAHSLRTESLELEPAVQLCLTSADQRGRIIYSDLLAILFIMQPGLEWIYHFRHLIRKYFTKIKRDICKITHYLCTQIFCCFFSYPRNTFPLCLHFKEKVIWFHLVSSWVLGAGTFRGFLLSGRAGQESVISEKVVLFDWHMSQNNKLFCSLVSKTLTQPIL